MARWSKGRSDIPDLFEKEFPPEQVRMACSVIRRIPNWILDELHVAGCWDDLWLAMLTPLLEGYGADLKQLYNAANRASYYFLKEAGYRKVKKDGKVVWQRDYLSFEEMEEMAS